MAELGWAVSLRFCLGATFCPRPCSKTHRKRNSLPSGPAGRTPCPFQWSSFFGRFASNSFGQLNSPGETRIQLTTSRTGTCFALGLSPLQRKILFPKSPRWYLVKDDETVKTEVWSRRKSAQRTDHMSTPRSCEGLVCPWFTVHQATTATMVKHQNSMRHFWVHHGTWQVTLKPNS